MPIRPVPRQFDLIAKCFSNNQKQLCRGENAYTSGHVKKMMFDAETQPARLQGEVQASMKKRLYKVEVDIHLTDGVVSTKCTCPRGQVLCHHIAALLYYAHYNISSTDKAWEWGPTTSKEEESVGIVSTVEELYPRDEFRVLNNEVEKSKIEEFRKNLGHTNLVGFSWLLKPGADHVISLMVPSIEEIIFCEKFLKAQYKEEYMLQKCSIQHEKIIEIAEATVGQHSNEGWLITRKMRLTASNFGKVLSACRRNRFPPSLFKSLMEGYDLHRALAVQWGKQNEETALKKFCDVTNLEVMPTGLWFPGGQPRWSHR